MKKIIIILFVFGALFSSCSKYPDNVTVLLDNSGTATINVVDNSGINIKGAAITLSSYNEKTGYRVILRDSTDKNGICNLGKVIQGEYQCFISAIRENKTYSDTKYFQIIAGENKIIVFNPFENAGDLKIKITDMDYQPIVNVNAALIPFPTYSLIDYSFDDVIDEAYFIGRTDSEGIIKFKDAPVNVSYSLLVYTSSNNYTYADPPYYFYVVKGRETPYSFTIRFPNGY